MTPAQRLAAQTWRWIDGDTAQVLAWLERAGMTVRPLGAGQWAIDGLAGVTVGLTSPAPDPVGVAVQLGVAWCGIWWPWAAPELLALVHQEWARRRRAWGMRNGE
jgi:hypothetical protein